MTKIKIEIELEIDFEKFFDDISKGLYKEKGEVDDGYKIETVYHILQKVHTNSIQNHMRWLSLPTYEHAKHHLLIDDEISKQIANNHTITIIK